MRENAIEIREIEKKDNQIIYQLIRKILESYNLNREGTAYTDPYLDKLYEFYKKEDRAKYWVLEKDGIIIGGVGIGPFGECKEIAELQKYYIKKEYQGFGYGSLLLNKALKFAEEEYYKKVYIETMDCLDKANRIYTHYGFRSLKRPLIGSEHTLMNRWFVLKFE